MAEQFQSRLDSVFGALPGVTGGWSVSRQIERREWRREQDSDDDDDDKSRDQDDAEDEGEGSRRQKRMKNEDMDPDMLEVQELVGMDTALDSEDEEDEFDQLAAGTQGASSRLYMKQIGIELGTETSLPTNLGELKRLPRDCRAYHEAAASRLAEDRKEAELNRTGGLFKSNGKLDLKVGSVTSSCLVVDGKRKDIRAASSDKRVRFVDGTKTERETSDELPPRPVRNRSKNLPDYLKNPEKYTHYFLDWDDEVPDNNATAWRSVMDAVDGGKKAEDLEVPPKSITFVPRAGKKVGTPRLDAPKAARVSIAAVEMDGDGEMSESAN